MVARPTRPVITEREAKGIDPRYVPQQGVLYTLTYEEWTLQGGRVCVRHV